MKAWKWWALGLAAAIVVLFIVRLAVHHPPNDFATAATVNGEPIAVRELQQEMLARRALIYDYFKKTYGVDDNPKFWTSTYGGENPLDKLRREALQESVKIKLRQIMAKQKGLVRDIGYAALLDSWKQENKNRADAVKRGKVIYGPQQVDEAQYYDMVISDLTYDLKQKMMADSPISDAELLTYYNAHKADYQKPDTVKTKLLAIPYGSGMNKEDALKLAGRLGEKLKQGTALDEEDRSFVKLTDKTFDDKSYPTDSKQYPNVLKTAQNLPVGRISPPIDDNGALYLVQSLQHSEGAYVPFDQVKTSIAALLMDQRLPEQIDRMMKTAQVVINRDVMNRLTADHS